MGPRNLQQGGLEDPRQSYWTIPDKESNTDQVLAWHPSSGAHGQQVWTKV